MISLALKTLFSDRGKFLIAVLGVVFSYVLVNVQGGLYFGMIKKSTLLIDHCEADIWVGHRLVENVDFAHQIPQSRLNRIKGMPGIRRAEPFVVGKGLAVLPDGGFEDVWVVGSEPTSMMGTAWSFVEGSAHDLRRPNSVSIDEMDARKLGNPQTGDYLEVNGQRVRVVAKTSGILGFVTTPYLFTTLENSKRISRIPDEDCSYYLIDVAQGEDVTQLQQAIQQQLPEFEVFTSDQFHTLSRDYWMKRTGIGIGFGTATLLGLLVGLLMVGQSLYSLALDHLKDYATLKAIGAGDGCISSVMLAQAMAVATVGSVVGIALVMFIAQTLSTPIAPIEVSRELLCGAFALVFFICLSSTFLPYLRICKVDPATVLQG